ncbi:MAG TPA: Rrf2 family transcriptional regulator [Bradyrhizobium sp.]|nr:Rrf2 family transcriptional regulator [Bradyrhizobium sp.]
MLLGRQEPGQNVNVEQIANQLGGLSRNHLHKIVQDLAAFGILRTVRGGGGGVSLAKPLSDIHLGALVRVLETDQAIVECFREDGGECVLDSGCRLRGMLRKAQECFYKSLDEHTLADCAAGPWFASINKLAPKASKRSANA